MHNTLYDRNGRLKTAWLPLDFPPVDGFDTVEYTGPEEMDLHGSTFRSLAIDTMKCTDTTWKFKFGIPDTTWIEDLYAGHPIHSSDAYCPCGTNNGIEGAKAKEREQDRSLQASCFTWIYKPGADYYIGHLPIHLDSAGPLARALSLDSAWLVLHTSSIEGSCITLTVEIPQYGFTKNFLFNCPDLPPGGGSGAKRKGDRSLQSGESEGTGGFTGRSFRVNLDSIKSQLVGLASGTIDVYLRVANPNGGIRFVNGDNAEDTRPKLLLKGTFQRVADTTDYTLAYQYDDTGLSSTITAKVDDSSHTSNRFGPAQTGGVFARRTQAQHFFGADYRLKRSQRQVYEPGGSTRIDTVRAQHDGVGQVRTAFDPEGNAVHTIYDASGRAIETINTDSTIVTTSYHSGLPSAFNISGQDFHGFCAMTTITNENGTVFAKYTDAFNQVRREIADTAGLRLTTLYEYDLQGRLILAINPKGDSTRYTYDKFGRVKTKSQPDIGTVSYAYDLLGNVRFTQTEKQAAEGRVTFSQYDDLNRLVYNGEANLEGMYEEEWDDVCADCYGARAGRDDEEHPTHAPELREGEMEEGKSGDPDAEENNAPHRMQPARRKNQEKKGTDRSLQSGGARLTDILNPNRLNDDSLSQILTANMTLWANPDRAVPAVPFDFWFRDCQLPPDSLLGETGPQLGRKIVRPAEFYDHISVQPATEEDFEHIGRYPEFGRMAVAYDHLPELEGSVWENFPGHEQWDDLTPTGKVRNLKGREAAVAYRERGSEPYNYTVLSYDERGRVEALLRFTENLGFDAVYYRYNSMNQITSITAADAVRQFSTYYGYDRNGRVDSVWTELGAQTSGLYSVAGIQYPGILERPDSAAILYRYNKLGMIDSMTYPAIRTGVGYTYNKRKWLDQMVAKRPVPGLGMQPIFLQKLFYDSTGQIEAQEWRHGTGTLQRQEYFYDPVQRLTDWQQNGDTTHYQYDNVGNRMKAVTDNRTRQDEYFLEPGRNRLAERVQSDTTGQWGLTTLYSHNANGSMIERQRWELEDGNYHSRGIDQFGYSHRELLRRYVKMVVQDGPTYPQEDWRYRYNAGGERDQKRLYYNYAHWNVLEEDREFSWQYYLLGGSKEQLAVYHGRQMPKEFCGDTGMRVLMYPVEYLTHANGGTAPIMTLADGTRNYRIADHLGSVRSVLNSSGAVISSKDFAPFGKVQAVTGVDVRQGYIGKELDRESEVAMHGVRAYSADEGRFMSGDVLWEKYRGWSPYQYSLNSPVQLTDHNGMFVDFGAIRIYYNEATAKRYESLILRRLEEITGLTLRINKDNCGLEVDWTKGINGGSKTAREALLKLIDAAEEVNVTVNTGIGSASLLGNSISLSYRQMVSSERGTVGLHPNTSSWGMIFFHETKHLKIMGAHQDPQKINGQKPLGVIAEPDEFANKIRAELGPEWGQRLSYWEYRFDNDPGYGYLPFTPEALNALNQGKKPETGYVRFWVGLDDD